MKAIVIDDSTAADFAGTPESLVLREVPEPVVKPGEVLIDVRAAGVNRADVQQRRGVYPPPVGASPYPGLEVSGWIAGFGPESQDAAENQDSQNGLSIGQEVVALLSGGGYAERVAVPAGQVLPVPTGVDLLDAAGITETAATVYSNLVMVAGLKKTHPGAEPPLVLIHGATGGIGVMAIQFARAWRWRVIATAGSAEKCQTALRLGAEEAINYRERDFVSAVAGHGGAAVIVDVVGGAYLSRNIEALAEGGKLIVIGLQGGAKTEINLAALMAKRASVIGTTLRARPGFEKARIMQGLYRDFWPLFAAGAGRDGIEALTDKVFSLGSAAEAHRYFDSGEHIGKVLLSVNQ